MAEPVLRVQGISKRYGTRRAVDDFSLQVHPGEFVALLGPNGAGKTTLFQMLTGLFAPDAGRAEIAQRDIRHQSTAALAALGVVFQEPTIDLEMTVERNLLFHARLHGLDRPTRRQRISEALAAIGLEGQAGDRVRTLSGGNRRRVEVARALLHRPRLLLMDEASVGLDPAGRRDLLARIAGLCREQQVAVLWATHLVDEVAEANRVVIMNRGHSVADAPPSTVLAQTGTADMAAAFASLVERVCDPSDPAGLRECA